MLRLLILRRFRPSELNVAGARHPSSSGRHASLYLFRRMSHIPTTVTPYRPSEDLKLMEWPEENLTLDVDEQGGFYPAKLGELFDEGRFVVTRKLGWGGFGNVWLARDRKEDRHVAMKVLSVYASREVDAGRLSELSILRTITAAAPSHQGFRHVLHLLHEFTFESFYGRHICLVTDVLSFSVPNLQKQLSDQRLPLKFILRLVKDVLKALEYLHDICGVVHSDLKPSNILLLPSNVDSVVMNELVEFPSALYDLPKTISPEEVPFYPVASAPLVFTSDFSQDAQFHWVIADFGHAHLQREHLSDVVQPYALRAPEVVLGLEWCTAIDIWSLGCLMYEWATGHWLFSPKERDGLSCDLVHLAQMTERTAQHHDEATLHHYGLRHGFQDLPKLLAEANTGVIPIGVALNETTVRHNTVEEVDAFISLMHRFLKLNPLERPTAAQALDESVFKHL